MSVSRRDWLRGSMMVAGILAAGQAQAAPTQAPDTIEIWPGGVGPGSAGAALTQRVVGRGQDPSMPDRYIDGITRPFLSVHRPAKPTGRSILITPGGGYQRVVVDKEGNELAPLLAAHGFTAFVLTYRLPGEAPQHGSSVALQDAQRAMRLIRHRATEFGIDGDGLGSMGFSAGGHVAATLGTLYGEKVYEPVDAADALSARPARQALIYPVISMQPGVTHTGSRDRIIGAQPTAAAVEHWSTERNVTADTPPTFLLHAADDGAVPVENSLAFHAACRKAGVPAELHVYAKGGHGFGHGPRIAADNPLRRWPELLMEWWG